MRGQTTLDFAVGVSVFLLALLAVLLFIPGTIDPFTEGGQDNIVSANRVASSLSEGLLGDPATPHVLNATCTDAFFEDTAPSYCLFAGASLTERVGLSSSTGVNVTIRSNLSTDADGADLLCWTGSALAEQDNCGAGDTVFRIGDSPPEDFGTTVSARRIVDIEGTDATLLVEVW
jgi:hypothetical protein